MSGVQMQSLPRLFAAMQKRARGLFGERGNPNELDLEVLGKLSSLTGDANLPPTGRLRGRIIGAGGGT